MDEPARPDRGLELDAGRHLYDRLKLSMKGNGAEKLTFSEYCKRYRTIGFDLPALIPQVYLHYDPYTRRTGATLKRQRMDFLCCYLDAA